METKTQKLIKETLKGLLITAQEKICVLGEQDAKEEVQKIQVVYEDLIYFWFNGSEKMLSDFNKITKQL